MASHQASTWISLSDMMTSLMLIFMLIAIITISEVKRQETENNRLVTEFRQTQLELHKELKQTFDPYKDEWGIEVTDDLVVKFNNPDLLFDTDTSTIKPEFSTILDEFIPRYLQIVNSSRYANKIKEIRIEGHTADETEKNPTYMSLVELSQARADAVLAYIRDSRAFTSLPNMDKEKLMFWFSANGLGNGRALDANGNYRFISNKSISPISRRVEFRIVTNSEELVREISS